MTDAFALTGLPRRPGLDENLLRENFFRLATLWHPDAPGGDAEKFRDLQEARRVLLDPAARLRHLLELAGAAKPGSPQPPAELFLEVASALEASGRVTAAWEAARSAIARAALAGERAAAETRLAEARDAVERSKAACLAELAAQDAAWPAANFPSLRRLAAELVFLGRWEKALGEAAFALHNPRVGR